MNAIDGSDMCWSGSVLAMSILHSGSQNRRNVYLIGITNFQQYFGIFIALIGRCVRIFIEAFQVLTLGYGYFCCHGFACAFFCKGR